MQHSDDDEPVFHLERKRSHNLAGTESAAAVERNLDGLILLIGHAEFLEGIVEAETLL